MSRVQRLKAERSSSRKVQKQNDSTSPVIEKTAPDKGKGKAFKGISDELKQAVKDLGGDDEDLELIDGVDEDEVEDRQDKGSFQSSKPANEKDIKKALGEFMKSLDFRSVGTNVQIEDDEDVDTGSEEEVEEGEKSEEGSEDEESEEDSDEENGQTGVRADTIKSSESKEKQARQAIQPKSVPTSVPAVQESKVEPVVDPSDPNTSSGSEVPSNPQWYLLPPTLSPSPTSSSSSSIPTSKLQSLKSRAEFLLQNLPSLSRKSSSADAAFISQILSSGTHQDKLSALVLLVRESPIHAMKELNRLRGMTGYKEGGEDQNGMKRDNGYESRGVGGGGGNKDQRLAVCKALVDWWVSGGGKESGKLRYFADQPLLQHPNLTDRHLLVFAFEDYLKKWFFNLLQVLEVFSHDPLPYIRTQALQMVLRLLQGNAEQEQNLLRLGTNKLGDTDKLVASKTSHLLLTLLQVHPAMKSIVSREISSLVLKPNSPQTASTNTPSSHVRFDDSSASKPNKAKNEDEKVNGSHHARYYGLITLNQITLTRNDQELAGKLVDLYFEVFREILGESEKKSEEGEGADVIEKNVGKVEKWEGRRKKPVRGGKGNGKGRGTGKGKGKEEGSGEGEMDSSDNKLIAAVLTGINRAMPYAQLGDEAFSKYMDTLFRITHLGTFNTSIQSLSLIFQIASPQSSQSSAAFLPDATTSDTSEERVKTLNRFYRTLYDSLFDTRLMTSSKQAMYLNLLFKALKVDTQLRRVMAFVKRLCQMFGLASVPFLSGALYLLGELFSTTPGLKRMLIEPEDDEEERFVDAPENPEEKEMAKHQVSVKAETKKDVEDEGYDGKKRDPLFAKADTSCLWELLPLTNHYHPSISLLSTQLLLSQPLKGSSDLTQNTLIAFLDKFVYRNPKKNVTQKGASVMQPASADKSSISVHMQKGGMNGKAEVNSEEFWRKKIEDVPVDQLFFHKFFSKKLSQKESSKKKKSKNEDEDEVEESSGEEEEEEDDDVEVDDEEEDSEGSEQGSGLDEDEVWKAMQASMPDAGDDLEISEDEDDDDIDEDVDYSSDEYDENTQQSPGEKILHDPEMSEDDDEDVDLDQEDDEVDEDEDDDEGFPDLASEDGDLIPLEDLEDMPDIPLSISASPEPEVRAVQPVLEGKRKRDDMKSERKERRKKRKELPLFGSYDEWQKIIEDAGNDGED